MSKITHFTTFLLILYIYIYLYIYRERERERERERGILFILNGKVFAEKNIGK